MMMRILCGDEERVEPSESTLNCMEMINELFRIFGEKVMRVSHHSNNIVLVHVVVSLFISNISITGSLFLCGSVNFMGHMNT